MSIRLCLTVAATLLTLALPLAAGAKPANDYPTEARVDYVIGCMMSNGQSRITMQKCSCSIDAIADRMSYDDYTAVETVKVMGDLPGERASLFRGAGWAKDLMTRFRQAQIAADRQCF